MDWSGEIAGDWGGGEERVTEEEEDGAIGGAVLSISSPSSNVL